MKPDLYAEVSARIIAELERGAAPWIKPYGPQHPARIHRATLSATGPTLDATWCFCGWRKGQRAVIARRAFDV